MGGAKHDSGVVVELLKDKTFGICAGPAEAIYDWSSWSYGMHRENFLPYYIFMRVWLIISLSNWL